MKTKTLLIAMMLCIGFTSVAQQKSNKPLPYLKNEHIFFIQGAGLNPLYHAFGYEFRHNFNEWSRIQVGTGFSAFGIEIFSTWFNANLIPTTSVQFGKKWIWFELGGKVSFILIDIGSDKTPYSGFQGVAPFAGIHFKTSRVFELGCNYLPVFANNYMFGHSEPFQFRKHWFEIKLRFILMKKSKKRQFGPWNSNKNDREKIKEFFDITK